MLYTQEDGSYQEHGDAAVDVQQFAEHEVADHGSQPAEQHGDTHTQTAATKTVETLECKHYNRKSLVHVDLMMKHLGSAVLK